MGKHAKRGKLVIGAVMLSAASFVVGQAAPPLIQEQAGAMTSKAQTRLNEPVEEFSVFYTRVLSWPYDPCQQPFVSSMDGRTADEAFAPDEYNIEDAIKSGRVLPWGDAQLTLLLSTNNPQDSITVIDLKPEVYVHKEVEPGWLAGVEPGGCGGAYQRQFSLKLEDGRATVSDGGVVEGAGEKPQKIKTAPIDSRTWTVSQNDISEVTIDASSQDGYYEFGVSIVYMLNGVEFERRIGTKDEPFKVMGNRSTPDTMYRLNYGTNVEQVDPASIGYSS